MMLGFYEMRDDIHDAFLVLEGERGKRISRLLDILLPLLQKERMTSPFKPGQRDADYVMKEVLEFPDVVYDSGFHRHRSCERVFFDFNWIAIGSITIVVAEDGHISDITIKMLNEIFFKNEGSSAQVANLFHFFEQNPSEGFELKQMKEIYFDMDLENVSQHNLDFDEQQDWVDFLEEWWNRQVE